MPTQYEKERLANIKRNRDLLLTLGLDELKNFVPPKTTKQDAAPTAKSRKRKSPPQDAKDEDGLDSKASKTRATQDITDTSGMRRSARNAGKVVDYKSEIVKTLPEVISTAAKSAKNTDGKGISERRHNPYVDLFTRHRTIANCILPYRKQYGHIPDIEVGHWWPTRYEASWFSWIAN